MKTLTRQTTFSRILDAALEDTGITKEAVADEMSVHVATVYRLLSSAHPSKKNIVACVLAVNKLAMYTAIDLNSALAAEGYEAQKSERDLNQILIASTIDLLAQLPEEVQADVLEMVKALHKRHVVLHVP